MKRADLKDTIREFRKTKSRFLAIFAIIAIGTGFFAGVKATCPDMKLTADKYFKDFHLMDLKVVSTYGLNKDDINSIKGVNGVGGLMPAYSIDAIIKTDEEDRVAKIHSVPLDKMKNNSRDYINGLRLIEGRLPSGPGECVIEKSKIDSMDLNLGDTINLTTGKDEKLISDYLNRSQYKIVGYVDTPYYLTFEKGTSTLGNGTISLYVMIPQEDFKMEVYTEAFVTFDAVADISPFSKGYNRLVEAAKTRLDTVAQKREKSRYDEVHAQAAEKVEKAKKELAEGVEQLKNAEIKLVAGQTKLNKGREEFNIGKKESEAKLADARKRIADSEKKLSEIEKPKWYITDRNDNPGYSSYNDDADRVDAIAKIFPVFFFVVAAFVCLTTMTRMVEEQRVQIGTYKALGYGNLAIASKFLIYAAIASVFGSIAGLSVGLKLFPFVIINAYGMLYKLPPTIMPFRFDYFLWITFGALACTSTAVYLACYKELRSQPAALMRPKSPKAGKRVLLERIPLVWSRLKFFSKVTLRNLFRYKKRLIMTLLGIAGCTALMLTGFGLKDSISSIIPLQYGKIFKYNSIVVMDENAKAADKAEVITSLEKNSDVGDIIRVRLKNIEAGAGDEWQKANLVVPEDPGKLESFISIHRMNNGEKIKLTDQGVIIGEKLAKILGLKVGSEMVLKDGEIDTHRVKVAGINENYALHYIYMTPSLYKRIYGNKPELNSILVSQKIVSQRADDAISSELIKNKAVLQITLTRTAQNNFSDMVHNLNSIVFVMIISAGALAFVVMYNLTNINVTERIREIASIKVLGFYDMEVSQYVFRENIILTIIDTAIGLLAGIILDRFVLLTSETDVVMFGREIYWYSFVFAAALTVGFSVLVNLVMYFRLKKVDMIESLKSVE